MAHFYANLWIVFILCGFWHGASWNFILWGAVHGMFLVLERGSAGKLLTHLPDTIKHLYALVVILTAWVLFRADTLTQAKSYLAAMYGFGDSRFGIHGYQILNLGYDTILAIVLGVAFSIPVGSFFKHIPFRMQKMTMPVVYLCLLFVCLTSLASNTYNPFLYFRF